MTAPMSTEQYPSAPIEQKCHLLELPGELRNRIWRLVVVQHQAIRPKVIHPRGQPATSLTNRTNRNEVLSIYFSENIFELGEYYRPLEGDLARRQIKKFRNLLGDNAKPLRHSKIHCSTTERPTILLEARLMLTGEIKVAIDYKYSASLCPCRFYEMANFGDEEVNGGRLVEVMEAFSDTRRVVSTEDCQSCGLPKLVADG